ncbi:peptidoglycan-binding protein [Streptomyces lunaelactis]|uniref:peptidoglycan-binding protein n=1 Tax=Streptomyces lunaelactis TaxID=1535768 RepID=UPI001585BF4E|nr:peptidoglycan-binding protein [Streptomyces lunaelactis]NUK38311.1 peptidoglycan-binding protein [Streptomyces lunaelactis]NUK45255.1 peptidoglycan-binding protein [Streptomyces lunaelactis]NUK95691.1 peptidoglycan-binding protein [Streptomyces lunaelactis]NUL34497.1 peptidoglycan-binding protein [Streptomyces lunaelactis]
MTESTNDRRQKLDGLRGRISSAGNKNDLIDAIEDALGVSAPVGDPKVIEALGKRYTGQTDEADKVSDRIDKIARKGLPRVWVGDTSVLASDVVGAASRDAQQMIEAFQGGGKALIALSDALELAQTKDGTGRGKLREARTMLGGKDGFFDDWHEDDDEEELRLRARSLASHGVDDLHSAAADANDAARVAARDLNKFAAEARAGQMDTDELTAADRLALADTSNVGGDAELNEILSANDLERSGRAMENLSPPERARMELLLVNASSPQEKAYLMKALASGYDVGEVEKFGGKIHGKDSTWLQEHLAPVTTGMTPGQKGKEDQKFGDENWSQDDATCVPSSTVTARALVDPVYALELTGGPDGQDNDPDHFRERLHDEQFRMNEEGDGDYDGWWWDRHPAGMDSDGQEEISNKEIGPHTGDKYDTQDMDGADDRRGVLPDIEKSVADGKPVPINISRKDENGDWVGHSLVIVGHEDGKLQVYNPWGTTAWVSEDDFINGDLSAATDDRYSKAHHGDVETVYIERN